MSLRKIPHEADYCIEYKNSFIESAISIFASSITTGMSFSGFKNLNSTFMDKIPEPYKSMFPLKKWQRWEAKFLNPDLLID